MFKKSRENTNTVVTSTILYGVKHVYIWYGVKYVYIWYGVKHVYILVWRKTCLHLVWRKTCLHLVWRKTCLHLVWRKTCLHLVWRKTCLHLHKVIKQSATKSDTQKQIKAIAIQGYINVTELVPCYKTDTSIIRYFR